MKTAPEPWHLCYPVAYAKNSVIKVRSANATTDGFINGR